MVDESQNLTVGAEIEKVFSDIKIGESHAVGSAYFNNLLTLKEKRGEESHLKTIGDISVGVSTPHGEEGLDNGFNLGESATGPFTQQEGGLAALHDILVNELSDVQTALSQEGATIINMSNHPLVHITQELYTKLRAPKPLYNLLIERGWAHWEGIDAKAQNSPSTGVTVYNAVDALNVILAVSPALIALYANSPFEQGRVTGYQESRLTMWDKVFGPSSSRGDFKLCQAPERPFINLRDYFEWMFGSGTNMYFVPFSREEGDYKKFSEMTLINGSPSLLEFLQQQSWGGKIFGTRANVEVVPTMSHVELHQWTQFIGARIRYKFNDAIPTVQEFLEALSGSGDEVEQFFSRHAQFTYIEGREAGANFPDQQLIESTGDTTIARSVVISPSAIQYGLIRNLKESKELLEKYQWGDLSRLRGEAIANGLAAEWNGLHVREFAAEVLDIASRGLDEKEHWMLAYPKYVLSSGKNGSDRALEIFEACTDGSTEEKIRHTILARGALFA
ncbi:MAG: glutamate-cysteine ligase family protein [Candidatus Uhrbacteria bacterium]|nr:glutamate-cysteine ligase family protein [Candidatus Uhrbacteria bacterium]